MVDLLFSTRCMLVMVSALVLILADTLCGLLAVLGSSYLGVAMAGLLSLA